MDVAVQESKFMDKFVSKKFQRNIPSKMTLLEAKEAEATGNVADIMY